MVFFLHKRNGRINPKMHHLSHLHFRSQVATNLKFYKKKSICLTSCDALTKQFPVNLFDAWKDLIRFVLVLYEWIHWDNEKLQKKTRTLDAKKKSDKIRKTKRKRTLKMRHIADETNGFIIKIMVFEWIVVAVRLF